MSLPHLRGICKIRNEAHIIRDTLDNWAQVCDAIHVYDDCSDDDTAQICREHPAVVEVIHSTLFDPDRERAEWYNRQTVLASAQRFMGAQDWVVYFDGDENLYDFDKEVLKSNVDVICCRSFDTYITPEDAHLGADRYQERKWVGPEWEYCLYFYRNNEWLRFSHPDQRNMTLKPRSTTLTFGNIRHWGKGLSVDLWERKCAYYSEIFGPKYQAKWEARKGRAVHEDYLSDYGFPLVLWEHVRSGQQSTWPRKGHPLTR